MLLAFDLDGTLLDTREAVRHAYVLAGVTPPDDWWGQPWTQWLSDPAVHQRKNEIYQEIAPQMVRPLPLLLLARRVPHYIVTGCSAAAYLMLRHLFHLTPLDVYVGQTLPQRIATLQRLGAAGLYFDDHLPTAQAVQEQTGWTCYHALPTLTSSCPPRENPNGSGTQATPPPRV